MAVWEAMSFGCPIVATDVGDVGQYIRDGENGYVVPVGDAQALADGIQRMLADLRGARSMGEKARQVACRELDIDSVVRMHAECYRQLIVDGIN